MVGSLSGHTSGFCGGRSDKHVDTRRTWTFACSANPSPIRHPNPLNINLLQSAVLGEIWGRQPPILQEVGPETDPTALDATIRTHLPTTSGLIRSEGCKPPACGMQENTSSDAQLWPPPAATPGRIVQR